MTTEPKRTLVERSHIGGIHATIWRNEGKNGPWYSATIERRYKSGDAWKGSNDYNDEGLLVLSELARAMHARCRILNSERTKD